MFSEKMETSTNISGNDIKRICQTSQIDDTIYLPSSSLLPIISAIGKAPLGNVVAIDSRVYIQLKNQDVCMDDNNIVTDIDGHEILVSKTISSTISHYWKSYLNNKRDFKCQSLQPPSITPKKEYWKILVILL